MTNGTQSREIILEILLPVMKQEEYSHIAIRGALEKYQYLDKQERSFLTRICEGTLERMIELDYIINQFSKVKVNKMKPVIRCIMRMSVYQLKYMDSVPNSAVCNEAVKLATKKGFSTLKGFVNGVLRNIERNLDNITYPQKEEGANYLSVKHSMPLWIVEDWLKTYGWEVTEQMLEGFLQNTGTTIRVNLQKTSTEELKGLLENQGITVKESLYLPYALEISGYNYLRAIKEFREGLFQVQDVSSMLVTEIANPKKGDVCMDVCAAPGGKCLHLADKLKGTGSIEARDLTEYKVSMIEENIERNGVQNLTAKVWDARILDEEKIESADVVLADLPCSGLGVLGKKTDLKYRMSREQQKELVQLQREILKTVQAYVKPGGTLVYSTCTINAEENEKNMEWFLKEFPFESVNISENLCKELQSETTKKGYLQMIPGKQKSDGFFITKWKRVEA